MVVPILALLLIVAVVGWGAWQAIGQTGYTAWGARGAYGRPVESGTFIVAMILLAILGVVFVPLLILSIIIW